MFSLLLSIPLSRPAVKEFRDHAEQQHIAAQQKAALQVNICKDIFALTSHVHTD